MAKLSVVIPFFNVEPYLAAALESVARQSVRDLEVIMVDDGSTDGSALIAKQYAEQDPRFRLVQQPNAGPGPARNAGTRQATGEYLAFVDGDDLLAPQFCELLVGSLEKTGSDVAAGGVLRFSPDGIWPSPTHQDIFRSARPRTSPSRYPDLLRDRILCNKVYRRSFWDAAGLQFPPGLYEDAPPVIQAYMLASAVDLLKDVVYYWRVRSGSALSTTQRVKEMPNLEDRMRSLRTIGSFLASRAPALKNAYDAFALGIDIAVLASAIEIASDADRDRIMRLAAEYLATVDDSVYPQLPVITRLYCRLMKDGKLSELIEVLKFQKRGDTLAAPVVRHGQPPQWYLEYPYFRDAAAGIPDQTYEAAGDMTLTARLDEVGWHGSKLRIEGHAYIKRLDAPSARDSRIRVVLCNRRTRRTIRLRVRRVHRPDVTARSGQAAACYDWSGFVVEVASWRLATLPGIWRGADWELRVRVSGSGISLEEPVRRVGPGTASWPSGRWVSDGVWVQPTLEPGSRFVIRGRKATAFLTGSRASDGTLELTGWTTTPLASRAALVFAPRRGGAAPVRVPVTVLAADGKHHRFRVEIPACRLTDSAQLNATVIDSAVHMHDEVTYDVSLDHGNGTLTRLGARVEDAGARVSHGNRELTVFVTPFGYLSVLERSRRLVISQLKYHDGRLALTGSCSYSDARPASLLLRHGGTGTEHVIPLAWHGDQFTAEFAPARMVGIGGELPLASGQWNLLTRDEASGGHVTVAVTRSLLPQMAGFHPAGPLHEIAPQAYRTDAFRLSVRTALADDERGVYAQHRLRHDGYRAMRRAASKPEKLRDLAVFSSFGGRQCSCNPRAIFSELRHRRPDLEYAWLTADGQFPAPEGARLVLANSKEHYEAMASARYIVTNEIAPTWYRKTEGQAFLQTWHGTPAKRIGLDVERPRFTNGLIYHDLIRDGTEWDLLISQNSFATEVFPHAFGFDGEIAEIGYPRNDLLHNPERNAVAAAIRDRLGIPASKRVVLYAPTWRDDTIPHAGGYRFALQLDTAAVADALGDGHVLLLRMHDKIRGGAAIGGDPAIRDVTGYPDISELLLITDVLVTDYSSVMFDFAATDRPMLFFAYDLEWYGDQRGFYFDLAAEVPGPVLRDSAELIEAIRASDQIASSYQQQRQAFAAKYCPHDDGAAAARAVDALLRLQPR